MKRLVVIFLVLMLLTASASAAEWADGLSPNKPNPYVDAVDFDKTIGYMFCHPNATDGAPAGGKVLRVYLPREDVKAGVGTLTLRSDDKEEEWTVDFKNTEYVNLRPMLENELQMFLWGSGVCFEITLPVSVRLGHTYYVDMSKDCVIDEARKMTHPSRPGEQYWHFDTTDDYGVSKVEYLTPVGDEYEANMGVANAGDVIRFDLLIGGEAKSALVYSYQLPDPNDPEKLIEMVRFDKYLYTESETIEVTAAVDDPAWYVHFFDVENPPIDEAEYRQHLLAEVEF